MAHIALLPFGSAGDVFPFLWLGRQLIARGHRVTMIVACIFEDAIRTAGLDVVPLGKKEDFDRFIEDPVIWQLMHGTHLVLKFAGEAAELYLQAIEGLAAAGRKPDLLLGSVLAYAAPIARQSLGIPVISVHVQPAVMISAYETPVLFPGMHHLRKLPLWLRKLMVRVPNPADRHAGPLVAAACARRGVTPPKSLWWDWSHSPDGVLCLFPEWFARPQPDWPPNLLQWDFPLEDMARERPLGDDVLRFLAAGDKPIVFTPGSANVHARRFFEVALAAVQRLGRRAIFATRKLDQLPPGLPATVLPVEYAPFSALVPHAAVFVHHGGIGTLSQGFAAGVPQLICAMAHDQPDNAHRLEQMGAGIGLTTRTFTPERVAASLQTLLTNTACAETARDCASRVSARTDPALLMDWVEARLRPG